MLNSLSHGKAHTHLLSIALPLILANITTPLLGFVDTAILGRMDGLHFLAGAAIATLILTQLYWVCGFIKMSITGQSAQHRASAPNEKRKVLFQGALIALVLALCILLTQEWIVDAGLWFAKPNAEVAQSTQVYFDVRVWGAPAALVNLAVVGWLIGQQKSKLILILQIVVNLINIIASYSFVYVFGMQVEGVALGTVLAEYSMLVFSLFWIHKRYISLTLDYKSIIQWCSLHALKPLLSLNSDMLVRNLALQFTLAFVMLKGAQFGTQTAAINAVLMQFFSLIALGLDGVANAVEALVGEAKGKLKQGLGSVTEVTRQVGLGMFWSSLFALMYCVFFYLFAAQIIGLLSNQQTLALALQPYMWVIYSLPLVAHWCFLFDGVYVGLSKGKAMRNNMLISTMCVFLPVYFLFSEHANQALWIAMFGFLAARGIGLAWHFYRHIRNK